MRMHDLSSAIHVSRRSNRNAADNEEIVPISRSDGDGSDSTCRSSVDSQYPSRGYKKVNKVSYSGAKDIINNRNRKIAHRTT